MAVLLVAASFNVLRLNPVQFLYAVPMVADELSRFFPPDFHAASRVLPRALGETLAISVSATFMAALLSVPLAFLAARSVTRSRLLRGAARGVIVLARGLPALLIAIIFVSALGLGPFAGALALAVSSVGLTAKLMADAIEHVPPGPREALRATGATSLQEGVGAILPQVAPSFAGTVLFTLDSAIRSSTIIGVVGAGGIGLFVYQSIQALQFRVTTALVISVFLLVFAIDRVADAVRRQLLQ
jgi:phosphonate transport system permease protein